MPVKNEPGADITPAPGRIVHVLRRVDGAHVHVMRPLLVVTAQDGRVDGWLMAPPPSGQSYLRDVPYSYLAKLDHWSWPTRL